MKATLFFLLLFPFAARAAEPSYAGTWLLDLPASASMPEFFRNGVKTWRLDVTRADQDFTVAVHIEAEGRPDFDEVHAHKLDGTRVVYEATRQTPNGAVKVPMTSVAKLDAKGIDFLITGEMDAATGRAQRTMKERWELSEDGQTLTVHREEGSRRGTMTFDMVFRHAAK